jgi:hypothetical protein
MAADLDAQRDRRREGGGAMSATVKGRRREAAPFGELPDDIQAGDYWRVLTEAGEPRMVEHPGNLTGGVWMVAAPLPNGAFALGRLEHHTVREHEDGTISVRPGDGSSNSIGMKAGNAGSFHGYIEHGLWRSA